MIGSYHATRAGLLYLYEWFNCYLETIDVAKLDPLYAIKMKINSNVNNNLIIKIL